MKQRWTIRPIRNDEIPDCACVIRESFRTVADEFGFTEENAPRFTAFAMTEERIRHEAEDPRRTVIGCFDEEQRLVGCYSLFKPEEGPCELNHLCVLPEFRHRHIGQTLVQDAFERALELGSQKMLISIVEENTVLKRWYEGFGFVPVGTQKFDFFPFTCGYLLRTL